MANHTPGPWEVYTQGIVRTVPAKLGRNRVGPSAWIAEAKLALAPTSSPKIDVATRDANAALIASAPTLLAQRDALLAAAEAVAKTVQPSAASGWVTVPMFIHNALMEALQAAKGGA